MDNSDGMSKKAQMEIMGLAIIVVLLMLGVLFAIRFVLLAPEENIAFEFKESQLAANTLSVLLQTHTDCHAATMAALLQDCATTASLRCPTGNSCGHAKMLIKQLFAETLDTWNRDYDFSIKGTRRVEDIRITRGNCGPDVPRESEAKSSPLPTTSGTIILTLRLCR